MIYQVQFDGWDAPILAEVTFGPTGVNAVSEDDFSFAGSYEQWGKFERLGWVRRLDDTPRGALDELAQIDRELGL